MTEAIENAVDIDDDEDKPSAAEHDLLDEWDPLADQHAKVYNVMVTVLNDGQWHKWYELWDHVAAADLGVAEGEALTHLRKVIRQGWVTKGNQTGPDQYRVTRAGLIERPELRGREGQFSTPAAWRQLREQVDWLKDPKLPRPAPVPEQPRPEPKSTKTATKPAVAPVAVPSVATIVATEGQLHPSENCKCGERLVFRNGKNPPVGDRWQCPLNKSNSGWKDPNHDRQWVNN